MMNLLDAAKDLVSIIQSHGFDTLYVGGCVRDQLLGLDVNDIDIATACPSETIQKIFPKTIPVGIKFGIIVVIHHGFSFEVATFREDQDYKDGRHPEGVKKATIEQDVKRRDFTINGLYLDPLKNKVIDLVSGQTDLKQKRLKAIGDPYLRFKEDHLRMIRAARYAAVLGFQIETETKQAIIDMASKILEGVSVERILQELEKMHQKGALAEGIKLLFELKLFSHMFHALKKRYESIDDLVLSLKHFSKKTPLIFPLLIIFDVSSPEDLENLISHFKMSNEALKMGLCALNMRQYFQLTALQKAELLSLPFKDDLILFQSVLEKDKDGFKRKIEKDQTDLNGVIERIKLKQPIVQAQDLLDLGIPKGPLIKKMMHEAMEIYSSNPHLQKETILKALISKFQG